MSRRRLYPGDTKRRCMVRVELAKRDMSMKEMAQTLGLCPSHVNETVNGVRRTRGIEEKIAAFLDLPVDKLFPRLRRRDLIPGGAS